MTLQSWHDCGRCNWWTRIVLTQNRKQFVVFCICVIMRSRKHFRNQLHFYLLRYGWPAVKLSCWYSCFSTRKIILVVSTWRNFAFLKGRKVFEWNNLLVVSGMCGRGIFLSARLAIRKLPNFNCSLASDAGVSLSTQMSLRHPMSEISNFDVDSACSLKIPFSHFVSVQHGNCSTHMSYSTSAPQATGGLCKRMMVICCVLLGFDVRLAVRSVSCCAIRSSYGQR